MMTSMDQFGRIRIMKKPVKLSKSGIHGRLDSFGQIDSLPVYPYLSCMPDGCKRNKFNRDGILRSVIEW